MTMQNLTQAQEKQIRALASRHGRKKSELMLIEGARSLSALLERNIPFDSIVVSEKDLTEPGRILVDSLIQARIPIFQCDHARFRELSETVHSQGILALVRRDALGAPESAWKSARLIVYLDGVSDPGNVGTIIRTCAAFRVELIALSTGSADLANPKVLRAAAGAVFAQSIAVHITPETLSHHLESNDIELIGTDGNGKLSIEDFRPKAKACIALGTEATGLSTELAALCAAKIRIPFSDAVESLNVAAAAAIVLYQTARRMKLL